RVRFPFDVTGGAVRFQRRRTRLRAGRLRFSTGRLSEHISSRPRLAPLGIRGVELVARDGTLELCGRARLGERPVAFSARLRGAPGVGGAAIRLCATEVRTYGFLPLPAPLLVLGIAVACGARAPQEPGGPGTLAVTGCDEATIDLLRATVGPVMLRGG